MILLNGNYGDRKIVALDSKTVNNDNRDSPDIVLHIMLSILSQERTLRT